MTPSSTVIRLLAAALVLGVLACDYSGTNTCIGYEAQVGEACSLEMPCADDSSCVAGTCEAHGEVGDACNAGLPCVEPYLCDAGTCAGPMAPETERCSRLVTDACAPGLLCGGGTQSERCVSPVARGEECVDDAQCPDGLACRRNRTESTCGQAPGLDESCAQRCGPGLICVRTSYGGDRQCVVAPSGEGELCALDGDCPTDMHCTPERSAATSVCTPDLRRNERCLRSDGARCGTGLTCHSGACEPIVGDAELCGPGLGVCAEGLYCQSGMDGVSSSCLPSVPNGASCLDGEACGLGAYCDRDREGSWIPSYDVTPTR